MNTSRIIEQVQIDAAGQTEIITRFEQRLAKIAKTIEREGLTVNGSQGQLRPHPLLAYEATLQRERERACARRRELENRLVALREAQSQDAQLRQANEMTAWRLRG